MILEKSNIIYFIINVADNQYCYRDNNGYKKTISIKRLQVFRNLKDQVGAGENVGIVLGDIPKGELKRGMLVKSI